MSMWKHAHVETPSAVSRWRSRANYPLPARLDRDLHHIFL